MGVNASIDWIRQCIAHAQSQGTPDNKLASFILDMYLLADFRTLSPKALLPTATQTPHKQTLFNESGRKDSLSREKGGGAILQIIEIQDIGISSLKMLEACDAVGVAGDEPGGLQVGKSLPQGNLSLELTDGTRLIRAILLEPIFGIAMEMMLGAKIRVRNADVRHGMLMLSSKNTFLLGGEVASMNEYPRRLVIMNQMKKRLGLPMDAIPGLNQNGANSVPATPVAERQSSNNTTSIIVNTNNNNTSVNTGWKNPQPAVSAQDAVPSITLSTPSAQQPSFSTTSNSNNKDVPYNPWKAFQRTHNSPPPPSLPHATGQDRGTAYEDEYLRIQREQEPVWDYHQDLEFDNMDMPGDDGGWEVMSQLSMNGEGSSKSHAATKTKDSSPPLIATLSPSRRTSFGRRNLSLRAPHSQDKDKARGEWEVDRLPKSKANNGVRSSSRSNDDSDEHATACPSSVGPSDHMTEYRRKLEVQQATLEESNRRTPDYDDFNQDHQNPFQDQDQEPLDDGPMGRKKRRTSPDSKSSPDRDHYPSRRRSQSFSTSHWNEEETKVDIKMEPGTFENLKKADNDGLMSAGKDNRRVELIEDKARQVTEVVRSLSPPIKIKVEAAETGANHAVIDLLSDDDDSMAARLASSSQTVQIKQEPGEGFSSQQKRAPEHWTPVKQEETLLEFEMDDEDDFGGLAEVIPIIPLVELTRVEHEVRTGREVKAKARLYKLGKFSLTTMSASIPITLLPVDPAEPTSDHRSSEADAFKLESVLEQRVVETFLQYSIEEFRSLVRINEAEAKLAVKNLRTTLLDVELVECQFKGLRMGIPVIRELTVLSKKRNGRAGSLGYAAPESFSNEGHDFPFDIFATGIIFIIMVTGRKPHITDKHKIYPPSKTFFESLPTTGYGQHFMERALVIDPKNRASADELLHHCFMRVGHCPDILSESVFDFPPTFDNEDEWKDEEDSGEDVCRPEKKAKVAYSHEVTELGQKWTTKSLEEEMVKFMKEKRMCILELKAIKKKGRTLKEWGLVLKTKYGHSLDLRVESSGGTVY
ncbi:hypothetical protein BG015_007048 [Linnemannia schmuckeri]|uniref:RecQ-mediated genome instability protein 1 n=1 Tax=Linnemannia schmuckeri TaxID=64567 RepID=A0A9P5S686_9FUNG|nr:hypothetical protein BG015_007048 [Linnemannia schmuckeri]